MGDSWKVNNQFVHVAYILLQEVQMHNVEKVYARKYISPPPPPNHLQAKY